MPIKPTPAAHRFWPKVNVGAVDECWMWTGSRSPKYGKMVSDRKIVGAHRVSWEIHFGPVPKGMHVLHKCDTPACVNPAHLFLGTAADNAFDMAAKERSRSTKLTAATVLEIRRLRAEGRTLVSLGQQFGVSFGTVGHICNGKTWRHLL